MVTKCTHILLSLLATAAGYAAAAEETQLRGNARRMEDFAALDDTLAALKSADATAGRLVEDYHPVFDTDTDSCLPGAAVSRSGAQNAGEPTSGSLTENCYSANFMDLSNTYHRWDRTIVNGDTYEVHMYELYFETDRTGWVGGHRHDVESVIMFFKNGSPTYVGVSAHGDYAGDRSLKWDSVPKLDGTHPKVVYHKDGALTHSLRFAKSNGGDDPPKNPTGNWVFPALASWFHMGGCVGCASNSVLRSNLNTYDFGSATFKIRDQSCQSETNKLRGEAADENLYVPFFDYGLSTGFKVNTATFSEEGSAQGNCPVENGYQTLMVGLRCSGRYCDNLRMTCSWGDAVHVDAGTTEVGWFSEEQGLRTCGADSVITGLRCSGRYCDNLKLKCKHLTFLELNGSCYETGWFSEEQGYREIPQGSFAVGIRCSGRYCDNKKIRYCYP